MGTEGAPGRKGSGKEKAEATETPRSEAARILIERGFCQDVAAAESFIEVTIEILDQYGEGSALMGSGMSYQNFLEDVQRDVNSPFRDIKQVQEVIEILRDSGVIDIEIFNNIRYHYHGRIEDVET